MNMTLAQKQALAAIVQTGKKVWTIAYNPNTMTHAAQPPGTSIFLSESTANLVEVIYVEN